MTRHTTQTNEKGQHMIDLSEAVQSLTNYDRYNGGWIKSVKSLNKKFTNGYSIVGDFVNEGVNWVTPGLFIDCSVGGSRKHHDKYHTLFELTPKGEINEIEAVPKNSRNWAVHLWDIIEEMLAKHQQTKPENPLAKFSTEELQAELKRRQK